MLGFNSLGFGTRISTALAQALIDYKKFTLLPVGEDGFRYYKNYGTNKLPIKIDGGVAMKLEVDQTITIPINQVIGTLITNIDGVQTITDDYGFIGDLVIGEVASKKYKDYFAFTHNLTDAQKLKAKLYPEDFFMDVKNGVITGDVLNLPCNMKGGYEVNYSEYLEGVNIYDGNINVGINGGTWTDNLDGTFTVTSTGGIGVGARDEVAEYLEVGKTYSIEGKALQGELHIGLYNDSYVLLGSAQDKLIVTIPTTNSKIYVSPLVSGSVTYKDIEIKELTGIHKIENYLDTVRVPSDAGTTNTEFIQDDLGLILGRSKGYEMDGSLTPALPIDMTDTELGSKFVFDGVLKRKTGLENLSLLDAVNGLIGVRFYTNRSYVDSYMQVLLYDGITATSFSKADVDENDHHVLFEYDGTNGVLIVDGIEGLSVPVSFMPSGLNFKDSAQPSPTGTLADFKIITEENYDKYDRQKSIEAGAKLVASLGA